MKQLSPPKDVQITLENKKVEIVEAVETSLVIEKGM
jgi:hypothetical protein